MAIQVVADFLDKYKQRIDQVIAAELDSRLQDVKELSPHLVPILGAMKELSVGGKRLRAMLTLLGYELAGKRINDEVIKAATVMEIFHLGLLIQDDFMDRDQLRRGVPTILARFSDTHTGSFVSMLAGDYTFGWSIEMLSSLQLPAEDINRAMAVWGKYFTRVGYGQTLDGLAIADESTVMKVLAMKSGEYTCVLPLLIGATLGGGDDKLIKRLEEYGMELGWVFQLRDDWLAEYGDSRKTGKPVGNDSREGKRTFATINGKEMTEETIEAHMKRGKLLSEDNKIMIDLVDWMGTREN